MSGLFDNIPVELWDEETVSYFRELKGVWDSDANPFHKTKRMNKSEWIFRGMRPANFPSRRIIGMSQYVAATGGLPGRPVHAFRERLKAAPDAKAERKALEELSKAIVQKGQGFWEHRMTVGSAPSAAVPALIGRSLARTLILNIVMPVLLCRSRRDRDTRLYNAVLSLYETFPRLDENQIGRLMLHRLWGPGENSPAVRHEIVQQGLIQVFFDFCEENVRDCGRCVFPEMIREQCAAETKD